MTRLPLNELLATNGPVVLALRGAFPHALGIYAFGSQVLGTANDQSDLDLAVLVAGYAPALALWDTASQLSDITQCHVDLLDLRAATTVMQHQILTQGRRLWGIDPAAGLFECHALTEKLHLDERRAALLADIDKEGTVYGR